MNIHQDTIEKAETIAWLIVRIHLVNFSHVLRHFSYRPIGDLCEFVRFGLQL